MTFRPDKAAFEYILSKYPLQTWWRFLNVGAMGVGSAFFLAMLFTYNWSLNPLLWRAFSPKAIGIGPGDHHTLIMLVFGAVFYGMVALRVKPIFALFGMLLYVYGYEGMWYLTYMASKQFWGGPYEASWMIIAANCIPPVVGYVLLFRFPWKFFVSIVPVFVGWFLLGFPITNDFPGPTVYYLNLQVNAFEILTHVVVAACFFAFVVPKLIQSSEKVKMKWWMHGDHAQAQAQQADGSFHQETISVNS